MRYRYYTDARHTDGEVASGHTIAVYRDSGGTLAATLYAAATGVTTVTNPYAVPATGIVDFWADLSTLYVVAQGEVTVRPLYPANESSPVNVKDYGAVGDGATDDTAAIQAAIDAASAMATSATDATGMPEVCFPPGAYPVDGFAIEFRGLHVVGAGRLSTFLLARSSTTTPIFSLGAYDSTPANAYIGAAQGSTFEHITFADLTHTNISDSGSRHSIGIQDNGSGSVVLRDVGFTGLAYGLYAPYGHDFCTYYNIVVERCDVGVYLGPGSQQFRIMGGSFQVCERGLVIEGAKQGSVAGVSFNEPQVRDIDILSPNTLESGVTGLTIEKELSWTFDDCWFETGAGFATSWEPLEHVRVGHSTDTNVVYGVRLRNVRLVSGTTGMGDTVPHYFLNASKGQRILIDGFLVSGSYIDAVVKQPGSTYYALEVTRMKTVDGYTDIPVFGSFEIGSVTGINYDESSAQIPRVQVGTSAPAANAHLKGEICWNSSPDSTEDVGWVCTVAGTPGTWKSFGTVAV